MTRCLKEQTLLLLHDGEGTDAERAHLKECEACAARYRELRSDLEAITRTLREAPPPKAVRAFSSPSTVRWMSAAVIAAWAVVVIWQGVRIWGPAPPAPVNGDIWSLVGEVSSDLFLLNEAVAEEVWMATADGVGALEAEWPCDWDDMSARSDAEALEGELADFDAYTSSLCGP